MSIDDSIRVTLRPAEIELPAEEMGRLASAAASIALTMIEAQRAPSWMTHKQAAAYLDMSVNALYKLTAAESIPFRKRPGSRLNWFLRAELDAWLMELVVGPVDPKQLRRFEP